MADHWDFIGIAVEEPGFTIWGTSPIIGPEGKIHLFVARWPAKLKVDPGWRSHSEVAHYVGDHPEGPFEFSDIALRGTGEDTWDRYAAHNPTIHKVGSRFVLLYIGNNNPDRSIHPANQCIGMAISESLYGPWKRVGEDGLILKPPDDPEYWNYNSDNGVNNPAFLQHSSGHFYLYFKSKDARMGLAIAEDLEGPYVQTQHPITTNEKRIEDGYAFLVEDKVYFLTTDNEGILRKGGGILWISDDGIRFRIQEPGFYPVQEYIHPDELEKARRYYGGNIIKFERPQLLILNNNMSYMYAPSGYNLFGGKSTVSYVLKFVDR